MEISMLFYYAENNMILYPHKENRLSPLGKPQNEVNQKGIKPLWASS